MATTEHGHGGGQGPRPETRDVDLRRITVLAAWLVVVIAVVLVVTWTMFGWFAAREAGSQARPATLTPVPADQLPPEPRLQAAPLQDLRALRAEEDAILTGYGWVDRGKGIVRIPVDRAMRIAVDRGLPARESAPREEREP